MKRTKNEMMAILADAVKDPDILYPYILDPWDGLDKYWYSDGVRDISIWISDGVYRVCAYVDEARYFALIDITLPGEPGKNCAREENLHEMLIAIQKAVEGYIYNHRQGRRLDYAREELNNARIRHGLPAIQYGEAIE